jgi:hypothetical protein
MLRSLLKCAVLALLANILARRAQDLSVQDAWTFAAAATHVNASLAKHVAA